jgi:hypothetical protein
MANVPTLAPLHRLGQPDASPSQPTEIKLAWDGETLYLLAVCSFRPDAGLRVTTAERDGEVWADDTMELFVLPGISGPYYHFGYNSGGARSDEVGNDRSWNCDWDVLSAAQDGTWTSCAVIPLRPFAPEAAAGDLWRVNVCRDDAASSEYTSWAYTHASYHEPQNFGWFVLGGDAAGAVAGDAPVLSRRALTALQTEFYEPASLAALKAEVAELDPTPAGSRAAALQAKLADLRRTAAELGELDSRFRPEPPPALADLLGAGQRIRDGISRSRTLILEYRIEALLAKWQR